MVDVANAVRRGMTAHETRRRSGRFARHRSADGDRISPRQRGVSCRPLGCHGLLRAVGVSHLPAAHQGDRRHGWRRPQDLLCQEGSAALSGAADHVRRPRGPGPRLAPDSPRHRPVRQLRPHRRRGSRSPDPHLVSRRDSSLLPALAHRHGEDPEAETHRGRRDAARHRRRLAGRGNGGDVTGGGSTTPPTPMQPRSWAAASSPS